VNKTIASVQGRRQKNFRGGGGAKEKKTKKLQKKDRKIALLSLYFNRRVF